MARWEQIGGDVNPKEYGAVLARIEGDSIEVIRIDPVEDEPKKGWWVTDANFDASDLEWDGSANGKAIASSIGASKTEWKKMSLAQRGEAGMGYHGGMWSGGTHMVSKWSDALPAASNSIKWWR
jgi:hypothetical protein